MLNVLTNSKFRLVEVKIIHRKVVLFSRAVLYEMIAFLVIYLIKK